MNQLIVADLEIRQDEEGRYCLNDLQKVATIGRNPRTVELHEFLRRSETHELIEELSNTDISRIPPVITKRGFNGGTFVVKELVYAYAMWISPKFQLKVIRAFDQLQTQGIAVAEHAAEDLLSNPMAYMEKVFQQAKVLQAQKEQLEKQNVRIAHSLLKKTRLILIG